MRAYSFQYSTDITKVSNPWPVTYAWSQVIYRIFWMSNLYSLGRTPISTLNIPNDSDINMADNTLPRLIVLLHNHPMALSSDVTNFGYPVFRKYGKIFNCTVQGHLLIAQSVKKLSAFLNTEWLLMCSQKPVIGSLTWYNCIQSISSHPLFLKSILISSSCLPASFQDVSVLEACLPNLSQMRKTR
jgi:hypothetical protein